MLQVLFSTAAVAEPDSFGLGTGRDGAITVTRKGVIINHCAQVTGPLTSGDTLLLVTATAGFEEGDLVMVLQTPSLVDLPHEARDGWELARLESAGQGRLVLKDPLRHSYTAWGTQVIRVPEYTQVTVLSGASLVAAPWNGETGGVVAFVANGIIQNDGEIGASGGVIFIRGNPLTGNGSIVETRNSLLGIPVITVITSPRNRDVIRTSTPTIRGTVEVGARVEIIILRGSSEIQRGNANVEPSGDWSHGLTRELEDGDYTLKAVARKEGRDDGAMEISFVVGVPPETNITSAPRARVNETSATFQFTGRDRPGDVLGFDCKLDDGAYEQCNEGSKQYSGPLREGRHTFQVRARDAAGNVDPTPSMYTWEIDLTAPRTNLILTPLSLTNVTHATFTFRADEAGQGYRCKLDSGPEVSCNEGTEGRISYSGLSEGVHVFGVYAVDLAGNVESPPTTYEWTVDVTLPDIRISVKPPEWTRTTDARFEFSSSEQGVVYECSLSSRLGGNFISCSSPQNYSLLQDGSHTFKVRAKDRAGNVSIPEEHSWIVDTTAPTVTIDGPSQDQKINTPVISGRTEAYSHVRIFMGGREVGGIRAGLDGHWSLTITSVLLADGTYTVTASATDLVGNEGVMSSPVTFTIDTVPPDTRIDDGPPHQHNKPISRFEFSADDATSFECSLDGAAFNSCEARARFTIVEETSHVLLVRAKDEAGNVDPSPARYDWVVHLTPPPPPEILEPQNGAVVYTYTPTISGTAAPGSEVEIFIAGKSIGKKNAEEDTGRWEIISTELPEGAHEVTGMSRDEAGNESSFLEPLTITVKAPRDQAQAVGGGLGCAASGPVAQLALLGGIFVLLIGGRRHRR